MSHNGLLVIIIVVTVASLCLTVRLIFLYILNRNLCNVSNLLSSIRLFQSVQQRRQAEYVARSLQNSFKGGLLSISYLQPQFIAADMGSDRRFAEISTSPWQSDCAHHYPVFQIARNGEIVSSRRTLISDVPSYDSVTTQNESPAISVEHNQAQLKKQDSPSSEMSSAEVLRNSIQPLGINTSLNIQRTENIPHGPGVGSSGSFGQSNNSGGGVPLDRPLYINTTMTAGQRIELYRRLGDPPQDDEPTLIFRFP